MLTRGDKLLIYVLISVALVSFFLVFLLRGSEARLERFPSASRVIVLVDGKKKTYSLNYQREKIRVTGVNGACILEISEGKVRVASSSCPRKICVGEGWISKPGDSIICIPMKIVVSISSPYDGREEKEFTKNKRKRQTTEGDPLDVISW